MSVFTLEFENVSFTTPEYPDNCNYIIIESLKNRNNPEYISHCFEDSSIKTVLKSSELTSSLNVRNSLLRIYEELNIQLSNIDSEYGLEYLIHFGNAKLVVGEFGDYVRVLDLYSEEIVYYNEDEIIDDPDDVLGAIVGAIVKYSN